MINAGAYTGGVVAVLALILAVYWLADGLGAGLNVRF